MTHGRATGFTLIELLVAIAITALVAVMGQEALQQANEVQEDVRVHEQRTREIQDFIGRMAADLRHLAPRSIVVESGAREPALALGTVPFWQLDLTRRGWDNPRATPRSDLQRVRWRLDGEVLVRETWPVLDRIEALEPSSRRVIEGVRMLALRSFVAAEGESAPQWQDGLVDDGRALLALEVSVELAGIGSVRRVIPVMGASP